MNILLVLRLWKFSPKHTSKKLDFTCLFSYALFQQLLLPRNSRWCCNENHIISTFIWLKFNKCKCIATNQSDSHPVKRWVGTGPVLCCMSVIHVLFWIQCMKTTVTLYGREMASGGGDRNEIKWKVARRHVRIRFIHIFPFFLS